MRRPLPVLFLLIATAALAACNSRERLDPAFAGIDPPDAIPDSDDTIDGIVVGDRLMEAREFELALRAYYRAAAESGLDADLLTAIGAANLALGRLGQAETQFRRVLDGQPDFVPALNNLGAVLIERGEYGEARRVLEHAFALDSGDSETIRDNLRLAIARMENQVYDVRNEQDRPGLIRRGGGVYVLTTSP
ncbi:tetratricopeptide repeat protein [Gymnodinialimonas sp. 2305UL16-5]|uniref:tetratricopeptide repeat protein n=1 Tax=Gymnodinialimonas mytili TaxID=3126503 RepID=UPI0030A75407